MDIGDIKYLTAPAKVLKLSEAIRIGSKIRPQGSRLYFNRDEGTSCAVGAAMEAIGMEFGACMGIFATEQAFPALEGLGQTVYEMNDAGVSREAIADWLESEGY